MNIFKLESKLMKLYRFDKIIAHGTFGIVYEATGSHLKEPVAVKRVYQDSRYKNRELVILKHLSNYDHRTEHTKHHPNVLNLSYFYSDTELNGDTYLNLVTPLYEENLSNVISRNSRYRIDTNEVTVKAYMW